jgi:ribosomal protein S18 acetylase RimI-like enzyme
LTNSGITIRSFDESGGALLAALQHADPSEVARWLKQPNLTPEEECFFAEVEGEVVAFGYLIIEHPLSRGVLIAEAEEPRVLRALIAQAADRAQSAGLSALQIDVPESNDQWHQACEAAGMSVVRTHHHMIRPGAEPTRAPLPPGMTTRLATRADVGTVTGIQNAAFAGSWGYSPNSENEIEYRIFELPSLAPDPVVMVNVDGQDLAYCWAHRERAGTSGTVGMVGVLPSQQGKGLGKLATAAGVNHLMSVGATSVEITVDSENGPAIHIYQSVGFKLGNRSVWYQRELG